MILYLTRLFIVKLIQYPTWIKIIDIIITVSIVGIIFCIFMSITLDRRDERKGNF